MSDMPDYVRAVYTSVKNTWQDAENLDDTHGYTSYIWIPEETFKVDVMKLWVFAEKFRAYSKSALSGGASVVTSTIVTPSHTHSVTIPNHTHNVTIPDHTHDVAIGTKTSAAGGSHKHCMYQFVSYTPVGYSAQYFWAKNVNNSDREVDVLCGGSGDIYTYEIAADHTHNVVIGTVTSASGGGTTVTSASGGGTTVTSASGGGSHSHDVSIPAHTHDIDYGIYEEAITGRTLSAILYDPDGNVLKDFGVVLTGEDNDTLNLSEYFATLKYGMYKVVLSASSRLRARLVFYELCKMYAQY